MKPNQSPPDQQRRSQQEPAGAAHSQQDAGGAPNLTGKALGEWASCPWRPGVAAVIKPLRLPPPGKLGHLRCDPFTLFRMLTTVASRYEILDELISDDDLWGRTHDALTGVDVVVDGRVTWEYIPASAVEALRDVRTRCLDWVPR